MPGAAESSVAELSQKALVCTLAGGLTPKAVRDRFDQAGTAVEKLQIMVEMERVLFDELRNFLIMSNRSRFLL
jgi:hypothetical protein